MKIPPICSWLCVTLFIFATTILCVVSGQCFESQKSLLLQVKYSLEFDPLGKLSAWNRSTDCCLWRGVTCDVMSGLVTDLDLSHESISPRSDNWTRLFDLESLHALNLEDNRFDSMIPRELDGLTSLKFLNLSNAGFNGPLPLLSMSKNLIHIDLLNNGLCGEIPTCWEGLHNLVNLYLGNNALNGSIPEFLFSLPSLKQIDLHNNHFSGGLKVSNVSSSHPLYYVDLGRNKLGGPIPISLFDFRGLKYLLLSSNNFSGSLQLDVLHQVMNLSYIDLSYNILSVIATDSRLQFPQMSTIRLASCKLRSFPRFLKNQYRLGRLDLSLNEIQGSIPNWIWESRLSELNLSFNSLTSLYAPMPTSAPRDILDLHSNQLQGPIPTPPNSAFFLDYSFNNFTSSIPSDIGAYLYHTQFFSISNNNIHGTIPASLCNAISLEVLDLSDNSLSGMIPACLLAKSGALSILNLRRNNLSGNIADSFTNVCRLKTLDLSGNKIKGKIPKSLANCQSLEVLNFGSNLMSDTFPCHLKNVGMSLRVLVLRSNQFYGHIRCPPESSGAWEKLQIIDLSSNNFGGKLPRDDLSTWEAMKFNKDETESELKYIQFEVLSGVYYNDVVTIANKGLEMKLMKILTVFTCIDLSSNKFEGLVPQELGNFSSLHVLNLSHNALNGEIPSVLGSVAQLESLDLSFNRLDGEIPPELAMLNFLSFLNLSHNHLAGKIPLGSQLQTFGQSSFLDNPALCGQPLDATISCTGRRRSSGSFTTFDWQVVYGGVLGFAFGSGMVFGGLLFTGRGSKWCDGLIDHIHFGILHPSWFIHTLLDCCRLKRM